jgi:hypothetical protein
MEWEFLLQKEGDRSWLPLDSPDVEILEGRYRIVARSSQANTKVEIRITHLAAQESPPKRRIQKRSGQTNQNGLVVIAPFTQLQPGAWELRCASSDLMSDLLGDGWQYSVRLQVLTHQTEDDWEPDWTEPPLSQASQESSLPPGNPVEPEASPPGSEIPESIAPLPEIPDVFAIAPPPEDDPAAAIDSAIAQIRSSSRQELIQITEQLSDQLLDDVFQDFNLTADDPATMADSLPSSSIPPIEASTLSSFVPAASASIPIWFHGEPLSLELSQQTLVACRGDRIPVSGQVIVDRASASESAMPLPSTNVVNLMGSDPWESHASVATVGKAVPQELQLYLRDPQTLQILVRDRQPLPEQAPPFSFHFNITLPSPLNTHLILGEVLLCGWMPTEPNEWVTLATQAFTITVDPTALVGELTRLNTALADQPDDTDLVDLPPILAVPPVEEEIPLSLDLSFLAEATSETPAEPPFQLTSLAGQPLPPQIYHPDMTQARTRSLELPTFFPPEQPAEVEVEMDGSTDAADQAIDQAIAPELLEITDPIPDLNNPLPTDSLSSVEDEQIQDAATVPEGSGSITLQEDTQTTTPEEKEPANVPAIDQSSPIQMQFQALQLQERFLTRLSSLAADTELSAMLKAGMPGSSASPASPEVDTPSLEIDTPLPRETELLSDEVVVEDDEPVLGNRSRRDRVPSPTASRELDSSASNPLLLPEDEPIPTPELDVTPGELVAGQSVMMRVRLPDVLPRIYVKLWVMDCETRSLLDGPRWLVDFLPNGFGKLEAITHVTVPFGSLEIRFEAIAVEVHTQRESHKIGVDRNVIPADMPSISLDDFDA